MQRILICTSVLGGGTVLVFLLAAMTAALFPHGGVVAASWNGGFTAVQRAILVEDTRMIGPGQNFAVDGPMPVTVEAP